MIRLVAVVVVLLGALIGVAAFDRPAPRADLTIIDSQDFLSLDPQRATYMQDIRACACMYEGLARYNIASPGYEPVPALARSWEVSPDGLTYVFHLEPTAKWSDGSPVRAGDFVYAWRRAMLPDTAADYSSLMMKIKGAGALFERRSASLREYQSRPGRARTPGAAADLRRSIDDWADANVGVRAIDDRTLRVTLERPCPYFLDLCAFVTFAPVHPATVERFVTLDPSTGEIRQDHGWTKPPDCVCNGPLVLARWRFKREARFEANPYYWDPVGVKSRSVTILPIEDQNTGILAFQSGAADWHDDVNADYVPEMLAQAASGRRDDIAAFPTFGTYFWNFNCESRLRDGRPNPFADPRVRRAFAMAVNKRDLVEKVKRGGERVCDTLVPPGSIKGYRSPRGVGFDLDGAKRLLAEAGWNMRAGLAPVRADGAEFPVVEMLVTPIQYHKDIAQALSRMWEQAFGVRTEVASCETKTLKEKLRQRDYMLSRANWWGDYGDPTTFLNLNRTSDGNNDRGYANPSYDALLEAAEREPDPATRLRLLADAERITTDEDLPLIPLWQNNFYYMFHPPEKDGRPNPGGLRGISTHPRMIQYYWTMEVVR